MTFSDNSINENQNNIEAILPNQESLNFKQAFWLIAISILIFQIYGLLLLYMHKLNSDILSTNYYLQLVIGGIVWDVVLIGLVLKNIRRQNVRPAYLFNFKISIFIEYVPRVLKYFSGCAIVIVLLSLISQETELKLEYQTVPVQILSMASAVIVAPIIEEMVFRSYLYTAMLGSFKRERERLVVNAMFFASAHVFLVGLLLGVGIPFYIFILGFLLAKLYEKSRSILPCILLHFLNNSLVCVIDLIKLNSL